MSHTRKNPISRLTVSSADQDIRSGFARRSHEASRRNYRKQQHEFSATLAQKRADTAANVADILNQYAKIYTHLKDEKDKKDLKDVMEILAEIDNPVDRTLENHRKNLMPLFREKAGMARGGRRTRYSTKKRRVSRKGSTKRRR